MRKFDLSLRSSRSSYFATFRHQLTILSKTDALDEEKWLNMLGTFVKDWFRYESHFVHGRDSLVDILKERGLLSESDAVRSEERFSRNAETDIVCRLLLEKKNNLDAPVFQHNINTCYETASTIDPRRRHNPLFNPLQYPLLPGPMRFGTQAYRMLTCPDRC